MSSGPIERRWREGSGDDTDRRIGELLRQVSDPPPLADARLDRVAATLERPGIARRRPSALRWVVAALVLGSGSAVFARHQIARLWQEVTSAAPTPAPTPARAHAPVSHARRLAPPPTPIPAPSPTPGPAAQSESDPSASASASASAIRTPEVAHGDAHADADERAPARASLRPPVAVRTVSPSAAVAPPLSPSPRPALAPETPPPPVAIAPAPPPPPAPPGLGEEARLVRRALEELRQARNPRAALATLDDHRARFAGGLLRADADLLRVEALLALDRGGEALTLLERLDLAASPRADELLVTRGELRASHDCALALGDFERALGGAVPQALAERALRGRAVCFLRLGDGRAEAALRAYVDRFPAGSFAPEARRRLHLAP